MNASESGYPLDLRERKDRMKKIWTDTFGDSPEYVDLIFDEAASGEYLMTAEQDAQIAASLVGVEYPLVIPQKSQNSNGKIPKKVKALYLCGLATIPICRRKGIMASLIEKTENKAHEAGIPVAFLIPADDHLREYYSRIGYRTLSHRRRMTIEVGCENRKKSDSCPIVRKYSNLAKSEKNEIIQAAADAESREAQNCAVSGILLHTRRQWETIFKENQLGGGIILQSPQKWTVMAEKTDNGPRVRYINRHKDTTPIGEPLQTLMLQENTDRLTILLPATSPLWEEIERLPENQKPSGWRITEDKTEPHAMFKSLDGGQLPACITTDLMLD